MRSLLLPVLLLAGLAAAVRAHPPSPAPAPAAAPSWSHLQATGPPDVPTPGDDVRAWASLAADAGPEWLELDYARAVPIAEVHIHQSFNPGAVVRVSALMDGDAVVLWEAPARGGTARPELVVRPKARVTADSLRITLDTGRVAGWNEIDAVAIVGRDGTTSWAVDARASSTYATVSNPTDPLAPLVGHRVTVQLSTGALAGTLVEVDATWLRLDTGRRDHGVLIARAHVLAVEW